MRIWVNFDKKTALGGNKGKNLGGGRKGGGRREEGGGRGREEGEEGRKKWEGGKEIKEKLDENRPKLMVINHSNLKFSRFAPKTLYQYF